MPMLALICLGLLQTTQLDLEEEDERPHHELAFTVDGGLSAGLPVAGWAGGAVRYLYRFHSGIYLGALGQLSAGPGMLAPRANFLFGWQLIDTRRFDWDVMLYLGWPLIGVQSRVEVFPLLFEHFEASLGLRGSAELLFNAEGDVFLRLAFPFSGWVPSLRLSVDAGLGVRSSAHVGATAALQLARQF